jgi:hypothetical protein
MPYSNLHRFAMVLTTPIVLSISNCDCTKLSVIMYDASLVYGNHEAEVAKSGSGHQDLPVHGLRIIH